VTEQAGESLLLDGSERVGERVHRLLRDRILTGALPRGRGCRCLRSPASSA
jgi:hypothetical protein